MVLWFVRLNKEARADLAAWELFMDGCNGKRMFLSEDWTAFDALRLYSIFYTDRSKAVLLLWFLTVLAVCVYTLVHLLC